MEVHTDVRICLKIERLIIDEVHLDETKEQENPAQNQGEIQSYDSDAD